MNAQLAFITNSQPKPMPLCETPAWRVSYSADTANFAETIAALIGGPHSQTIANKLLAQFTTAQDLDAAPVEELASIKGVSKATAIRLKAALALGRRLLAPPEDRPTISSPADAARLLQPLLIGRGQEYLYVLLLDTRNRVIGPPRQIYHGSLNTSLIRVGEIFKDAIRANAANIIIAHNHPSGVADPSPEDVAVTRAIIEAGKLLDIDLLDHLVIGNPKWVSLKERGLGFN